MMIFVRRYFGLVLIIFGALPTTTTTLSVSRIQACAEIEKTIKSLDLGTYKIKVLIGADGSRYFDPPYAYIPILYNSENQQTPFSPAVQIVSIPPSRSPKLCCNNSTCGYQIVQECSGPAITLSEDHAGNGYRLNFNSNKDGELVTDLLRLGVRYYSLFLHYSESSSEGYRLLNSGRRASSASSSTSVGITLAFFSCSETKVKFINEDQTETVKIRRLAFLNGNGGDGPIFPIYQASARLSGPIPPGATFGVSWDQSWGMDGRFFMKGDLLYINNKNISLKTDDKVFKVSIEMTTNTGGLTRLPMKIVARAENRYNPIFIGGCKQPQQQLQVAKVKGNTVNCAESANCHLALLDAKDYDGDLVYFSSLEVIEPIRSDLKDMILKKLKIVPIPHEKSEESFQFSLFQTSLISFEDLTNWANAPGPKGYVLIRINICDRPDCKLDNTNFGSCVMRLNLEPLDGVSREPTFISPSSTTLENPLQISIRQDTPHDTVILQVLAVDWIAQKLQIQNQKQQQVWYYMSSANMPFSIGVSDGKIKVTGSLQYPSSFSLNISASLKMISGRSAVLNIKGKSIFVRIAVISNTLTQWTPRFEPHNNSSVVIPDGDPPDHRTFIVADLITPTSSRPIEKADLSCIFLDNKDLIATCDLENSSVPSSSKYGIKVAFTSLVGATGDKVTFDYSHDRQFHLRISVTHKGNGINHPTEFGVILYFSDTNNRQPETFGTTDYIIPQDHKIEDQQDEHRLMSLFLFDRDISPNGVNNGYSCKATVQCHSVMGPSNILTFEHEEFGSGYLKMNSKFSTSGKCEIIAEDSNKSSCSATPKYELHATSPSVPLVLYITEQPINEEPIDVLCQEPGIYQTTEPFQPTDCRVVPAADAKSMRDVLRDNVYYFVTDPTGTFAANPTNGSIYLLQPVILKSKTMSEQVSFPINVAIFNGRKLSKANKTIKIANNYLSRPNLVDLYHFSTPSGDVNDTFDYSTQTLKVEVPAEIDPKVPILSIVQKTGPRDELVTKSNTRSISIGFKKVDPYLVGPQASFYRLEKLELRNGWNLYRSSEPLATTTTSFFRAAQQVSIIGTNVQIAAHYPITYLSKNVTIGNILNIHFTVSSDRLVAAAGLAWYWILVIILGFVFLIFLGLLILFLLARSKRRKVGHPDDLPGSPTKFVSGHLSQPSMSPNVNFEPSFDSILSSRLQMANLAMISPSSGRANAAQWHGDDGFDTVTISSGITDTPLNLSVLNQYGPEYTDLAETCGVAKRV